MNILYTHDGLVQKVGGVSRYFYEISKRMNVNDSCFFEMLFCSNDYFSEILKKPKYLLESLPIKGKNRLRNVLERMHQYVALKTQKYDIVHHTGESIDLYKWSTKPVVVTIHDMIPEIYHYNQDRIIKRKQNIEKSDAIICVSENTKKDLLKIYPNIPESKITVIYHGFNPYCGEYSRLIFQKYILYVGSRREIYKNFIFSLNAIKNVLKKYQIVLVCTGQCWNDEELRFIKENNLQKYILSFGFANEFELASLYRYAECFIYPSAYEGFGIPILEAWTHNCPVCLSDSSCFPEIAGDAAMYFNPSNPESVADTIERVISDGSVKNKLREKSSMRLRYFSWDRAAKETQIVYQNVLRQIL